MLCHGFSGRDGTVRRATAPSEAYRVVCGAEVE